LSEEISHLSIAWSFRLTDAAGGFEAAMRALRAEYDGYDAHRSAVMVAQLSIALGCLLRLSEHRAADNDRAVPARARQHVARFIALVDAAYAGQSGLEYYASQIGISAAHLNASCRQVTGQSALSIIHARSMREARRLLVYTSMTIRDVSDTLGFSDPAYFTRFFKRNAGLSPRDFRLHATSWNAGSAPISSS
jgi:AraC family transcriptional activator of pobA